MFDPENRSKKPHRDAKTVPSSLDKSFKKEVFKKLDSQDIKRRVANSLRKKEGTPKLNKNNGKGKARNDRDSVKSYDKEW